MADDIKRLTKSFGVVKELPEQLKARKPNGDRGQWFWATKEIVDSEGDLIDVEGISLEPYSDPANGVFIKACAQHLKALPDGTAPVVGRVTDYAKVVAPYRRKAVKALAVYVEWLRDPATDELLPLAAHYKQMVESGGIDQVSVGLLLNDYEVMDNGGIHVLESALYEVSLVTVPANAAATTIKALEERLGDALDKDSLPPPQQPAPTRQKTADVQAQAMTDAIRMHTEQVKNLADAVEKMRGEPDAVRGLVEGLAKSLDDLSDRIVERLDVLESAVVVLTQPAASGQDDQRRKLDGKALQALGDRLDGLLKTLAP